MLLAAALAALTANGHPDRYALLVNAHGELRHQGNISMAYQVLLEQGYRRDDIFILSDEPEEPYYPNTGPATLTNLRALLAKLAVAVEPEDELFVYVTGHGRRIEATEVERGVEKTIGLSTIVMNKDEDLERDDFLAQLARIHPGNGTVFADLCYFGPFELTSWAHGTFINVARIDRTSYGNAFPREFWTALRGQRDADMRTAFATAAANDPGAKKGFNSPELTVR